MDKRPTKKQMRAELRRILREVPNLRAIRMIQFLENKDGIVSLQDIAESDHIVQRGFKYGGYLEFMCVKWEGDIVEIEAVQHD